MTALVVKTQKARKIYDFTINPGKHGGHRFWANLVDDTNYDFKVWELKSSNRFLRESEGGKGYDGFDAAAFNLLLGGTQLWSSTATQMGLKMLSQSSLSQRSSTQVPGGPMSLSQAASTPVAGTADGATGTHLFLQWHTPSKAV